MDLPTLSDDGRVCVSGQPLDPPLPGLTIGEASDGTSRWPVYVSDVGGGLAIQYQYPPEGTGRKAKARWFLAILHLATGYHVASRRGGVSDPIPLSAGALREVRRARQQLLAACIDWTRTEIAGDDLARALRIIRAALPAKPAYLVRTVDGVQWYADAGRARAAVSGRVWWAIEEWTIPPDAEYRRQGSAPATPTYHATSLIEIARSVQEGMICARVEWEAWGVVRELSSAGIAVVRGSARDSEPADVLHLSYHRASHAPASPSRDPFPALAGCIARGWLRLSAATGEDAAPDADPRHTWIVPTRAGLLALSRWARATPVPVRAGREWTTAAYREWIDRRRRLRSSPLDLRFGGAEQLEARLGAWVQLLQCLRRDEIEPGQIEFTGRFGTAQRRGDLTILSVDRGVACVRALLAGGYEWATAELAPVVPWATRGALGVRYVRTADGGWDSRLWTHGAGDWAEQHAAELRAAASGVDPDAAEPL